MSASRLIVCLDPARLLRPPIPVLFPEWGRELMVLSKGTRPEDWSRVASALAASSSCHVRPEVWYLTDAEHWNTLTAEVQSLCATAPAAMREQLLLRNKVVLWLGHATDDDGSVKDAVILRTRFEGPVPAHAAMIEQLRLLPMGIRALLDRQPLLASLGNPTQNIRSVNIIATVDGLQQAELAWGRRLMAAERALDEEPERLKKAPCVEPLLPPERFSLLKPEFSPEPMKPLSLSLFQKLHVDEEGIKKWFTAEAGAINQAVGEHHRALAVEFDKAVRKLAGAEPTVVSGAEAKSCVDMRKDVRAAIEADTRPKDSDDLEATARGDAQEWTTAHRVNVLTAAGRRATVQVYWAAVAVALLTCAISAGVVFDSTTPAAAHWRELLRPLAVLGATVLLVSVAAAAVYWQLGRRAVRAARDDLVALHNKLRKEAASATFDAEQRLRRMVQFLNLATLERACAEQHAHITRVDVHADAVRALLATVHEHLGQARAESVVINPDVPIEMVPDYWWGGGTASEPVRVFLGAHAVDGSESRDLHDTLRRYAGALRIEIG